MTNLTGKYYNGLHPIGIPVELRFDSHELVFVDGEFFERYSISDIMVSPRVGSAHRFINLPDDGQLECDDHPVLDTLPQESPSEGPVAWLEKRWPIALLSVITVFALLIVGYLFGLPVAAKAIVGRISLDNEQSLSSYIIDSLDKRGLLKPTTIDDSIRDELTAGFESLHKDLPFGRYYTLEFRSGIFGANAFALPGGIIVITDEMVETAESHEEIFAILAHEIGHIELRHPMRSILQKSLVAVTVTSVSGDATSLNTVVTGLPLVMAQSKYSREFETEADDFCFQLLKKNGYSPNAFASIMERIAKKAGEKKSRFNYISTHPSTYERIRRARAAATDE